MNIEFTCEVCGQVAVQRDVQWHPPGKWLAMWCAKCGEATAHRIRIAKEEE